jgi:hypothetical protein
MARSPRQGVGRGSYPYADEVRSLLTASGGYGYHGTSVWAILDAASFGVLPNRLSEDPVFYYFPSDYPHAFRDAEDYALSSSGLNYARAFLGYKSLDDTFEASVAGDPDVQAAVRHVVEEGALCGIVVGIKETILNLRPEAAPKNERCVRVPRGLPLRYVQSVQVLGKRDREILADARLV